MKNHVTASITLLSLLRFRRAVFIIILWAIALCPSGGMYAQDSSLRFTHKERSLQPGEVILYDIHCVQPLKKLQLTAFNRQFPAFPVQDSLHWKCLIGIDRDAKPGSYDVKLTGLQENGDSVSVSHRLRVQSKEFPTRVLTVEPKYVTPPAEVEARIQKERELVDAIFSAVSPKKLWDGPFRAPVPGEVISAFGKRSIYNGQPRSAHSGTDFRGAVGTLIHAPNSGRVVFTGDLYYTGNTVIIDHGLGMYSYLGHMSAITVRDGDAVKIGDIVGKVGATGRVTGPHLHWTVRLDFNRVDPISLIYILTASSENGT